MTKKMRQMEVRLKDARAVDLMLGLSFKTPTDILVKKGSSIKLEDCQLFPKRVVPSHLPSGNTFSSCQKGSS